LANINAQLQALTPDQKVALLPILQKLQAGKRLSQKDVGLLGIDYTRVAHGDLAGMLDVSKSIIHRWVRDGCPKNSDGTFHSAKVCNWRIEREKKRYADRDSVDTQKKLKEIEYKAAQIDKIKDKTMLRTDHETLMCSRAASLKTYAEITFPQNAQYFTGLTLDEARTRLVAFAKNFLEAFTGEKHV